MIQTLQSALAATPRATRILFVDDEPGILAGLRNALRKQRLRWDMVFVGSGAEALQALDAGPFDVVVSDMRMPRMDGAELLTLVRRQHPGTARIVLSGHAEHDAIVRVLPVAHQFLIKPCEPAQLEQVIERTVALQGLLGGDAIRGVVGSLDSLPSLPVTYFELTRAVQDADVDVGRIVAIVERDPAMCIKVLQLVNSSYFGLGHKVTSTRHAVAYLGLDLLKGLVLSAHIFSTIKEGSGAQLAGVQQNALVAARLARRFMSDSGRGDEGFTAGLVHDVGQIVLAGCLGPRYEVLCAQAADAGQPYHDVERREFGFDHAQVGAYLLGIWGLPLSIVEAVAWHHEPAAMPAGDGDLLAAVHVASALCAELSGDASDVLLDADFIEGAGLTPRIAQWRRIAAEEALRSAA